MSRVKSICLALAFFFPGLIHGRADGTALEDSFQNPPESAKPLTYWMWASGNDSEEGITADLEAMKRIDLGGVFLFTVDQSSIKGPVKFMTPAWRQMIHHALSESARLNLEISLEGCEGELTGLSSGDCRKGA